MTFNGPPSQEKPRPKVETPEYWKENAPLKSPRAYFELQYEFAKLMAERTGVSLMEAIDTYAPIIRKAIHRIDDNPEETELIKSITEKNVLNTAYTIAQIRRKRDEEKGEKIPFHDRKDNRFGCSSYDYDESTRTINVHFFNAEAEEEWVDEADVSRGPLSSEKLERRRQELAQMFRDIKARHPNAKFVNGRSNLYNLASYRRLYPESYEVGGIDYRPERWGQGMSIWGQFLGGNEKVKGEYGFKQNLAKDFLEKVKTTPVDRLADALPNPPRFASGNIQDFYDFYGIT